MKKIHTTSDDLILGLITTMLEQSGIDYFVRNRYLSGALGEIPATECWPEIWIAHDGDLDAATAIVDEATRPPRDPGPWRCRCGEENAGTFGSCWKCGKDKDSR